MIGYKRFVLKPWMDCSPSGRTPGYRWVELALTLFLIAVPGLLWGSQNPAGRLKEAFWEENRLRTAEKLADFHAARGEPGVSHVWKRVAEVLASAPPRLAIPPEDDRGLSEEVLEESLIQPLLRLARAVGATPAQLERTAGTIRLLTKFGSGQTTYFRLFDLYRVEAVSGQASGTFRPTEGFPQRVEAVAPGRPHTLNNLDRYLFDRVPRPVLADLLSSGRRIEFHVCSKWISFSWLRERGYTEFFRISTISGMSHRDLYLVSRPGGSDAMYVANHILGEERLWHVLLMFRLVCLDGRFLPASQVLVVRHSAFDFRRNLALFRNSLAAEADLPARVIINYQNSLLGELLQRKRAALRFAAWARCIGGNPWTTLAPWLRRAARQETPTRRQVLEFCASRVEALQPMLGCAADRNGDREVRSPTTGRMCPKSQDGAVLEGDPRAVFRSRAGSDAVTAIHRLLTSGKAQQRIPALAALSAPTLVPPEQRPFLAPDCRIGSITVDHVLDRATLRFIDGRGKPASVIIFRCVWGGDNVEALAQALAERLATATDPLILHLGTGGSLDSRFGAGTVHFPQQILDIDGRRVDRPGSNLLRGMALRRDSRSRLFQTDATLIRVWSPLVETVAFWKRMLRRGITTIEVEVAAFHRALRRFLPQARTGTMLMMTDLLGSDLTLEQHGTGNIDLERRAFRAGFDLVREAMDIADLPPEAISAGP